MASNMHVLVCGHMIVSTPARKNTSMMSAMDLGLVTMRSTDRLLPPVQWVYPRNQFGPDDHPGH